jgi:hypothetical protein
VYDELSVDVSDFMSGNRTIKNSAKAYDALLVKMAESELPANVQMDLMLPLLDSQGNTAVNSPFYTDQGKQSVEEQGMTLALNAYRKAHEAAMVNAPASIRMAGFGNGFKQMYSWAKENPELLTDPVEIRNQATMAAQPTVSNRLQQDAKERNASNLSARPDQPKEKVITEQFRDEGGNITRVRYSDGTEEDV